MKKNHAKEKKGINKKMKKTSGSFWSKWLLFETIGFWLDDDMDSLHEA